jgi:rod shape-determining protein MreD
MKNPAFLAVIFLFGVLQATFLNYFMIFGIKPDLLIISMILVSVFFNWKRAVFFSVYAGALKDIFGIESFGLYIAVFACWSYLIARVSRKISIDDPAVFPVIVGVVVLLNGMLLRFINISLGKPIPLGISLRIICIEAFYTALVCPLVFSIFYKLNGPSFKMKRGF